MVNRENPVFVSAKRVFTVKLQRKPVLPDMFPAGFGFLVMDHRLSSPDGLRRISRCAGCEMFAAKRPFDAFSPITVGPGENPPMVTTDHRRAGAVTERAFRRRVKEEK